jgi:hypothetical protein
MRATIHLLAVGTALAAGTTARADFTQVLTSGEPSLAQIFSSAYAGDANILTMAQINSAGFSIAGYTFTRLHDFGSGLGTPTNLHNPYAGLTTDALFQDGTAQVEFRVKYAGYNNGFGWSNQPGSVNAGNYQSIIAPGAAPGTSAITSMSSNFQFALKAGDGNYWGTNQLAGGGFDHFVTWYVQGNGRNFWLMAVEDLNLGDRDYNDWVGEITLIPLPPAAWAASAGLVMVGGIKAFRRRKLMR